MPLPWARPGCTRAPPRHSVPTVPPAPPRCLALLPDPFFLGARSSLLLPSSRTPKTLLHSGSIQADFRCPSCCAHSAGAWHSHRRDPDIDTVPGGGGAGWRWVRGTPGAWCSPRGSAPVTGTDVIHLGGCAPLGMVPLTPWAQRSPSAALGGSGCGGRGGTRASPGVGDE